MPLLNYTTKVPVSQSVREITAALVKGGASSIMTDFDDKGEMTALSFKIVLNGTPVSFRLPSDWKATLQVMNSDGTPSRFLTNDHARRVAWRILKDWVEAQMALLATKSVSMPQLFLPYAVDAQGTTLYEKIAQNPSFLLGDGR